MGGYHSERAAGRMMECANTSNGIKYKQFVITLIPVYIKCFDQKHLIRFIYFLYVCRYGIVLPSVARAIFLKLLAK